VDPEYATQRSSGNGKRATAERRIERVLLGARWLLLPFYALLLVVLLPLLAMLTREFIHLVSLATSGSGSDVILAILSMLDLVLLANLVTMVAVSSFESYVSRIEVESAADRPEWLGRLDSGGVKVKVAVSITMIAAVHLLRGFMNDADPGRLAFSAGVLLVFVLMSFVVARTGSHIHSGH
jgi:uncharacterized protein (TIGR00645 family)